MSKDNSSYEGRCQQTEYIRKNKLRTKTASSTLESSPSHCLIFVRRSLRRRNPLTPFAFAHFFSTCSTPASSLLIRQTMEQHSRRTHKPLKRTQNGAQAIRKISLVQTVPLAGLADIDNNVRDSGKLMHYYFTLFLALLHLLLSQLPEYVIIEGNNERLASRMVSVWSNRPATGAINGIFVAKALPICRAAREVLIALIAISLGSSDASSCSETLIKP